MTADDRQVIRFFSDTSDVPIVREQNHIDALLTEVSGDFLPQLSQSYQGVRFGRSSAYPRSAPVFASSSVEVYSSPRFSHLRHRRALNVSLLSPTSSDSLTQARIGVSSQAFVAAPFSASQHEATVLGAFLSGTQAIGSSPVPYSASLYYEKPRELRHVTWKLTASSDWGGYTTSLGQLIQSSASTTAPHIISISAPAGADEGGRIVDVKLWIEVTQVSGNNLMPPLGQFGIALRNPRVSWGHAHPIRNYLKDGTAYGPFETPSEFYRDTYLLWEPSGLYRDPSKARYGSLSGATDFSSTDDPAAHSPVWDRDMGMRTVFCDGAHTRNPRDIYQVYMGEFAGVRQSQRAYSAPNFGFSPLGTTASMLGNGYPWYDDPDISSSFNNGYTGAPPPGWLSGPGGTFAANEWPTSGSNVGPHFIRGVYPMLDDIYVRKLYQLTALQVTDEVDKSITPKQYWRDWIGFRPGLRGKEMGTRWEILFAHGLTGSGLLSYVGTYFRQARLEFTYELTPGTKRSDMRPPRSPRRSGVVPVKPGLNLVSVISGSKDFADLAAQGNAAASAPDFFISGIYVMSGHELEADRSIGITYDEDEFYASGFAVYTGSVAIFEATASYQRADVLDILAPSVSSGGPRTLSQVIAGTDAVLTTTELARIRLSGSL